MADKIIISIKDIDKLVLPDGYELKRVKTKAEKITKFQTQINELKLIKEPINEELIIEGKIGNPYYMNKISIEILEKQIKELNEYYIQ